jgi:glycine hydroxymethyltransferase
MREIAGLIAAAVRADPATNSGTSRLRDLAAESSALAARFPVYASHAVPV